MKAKFLIVLLSTVNCSLFSQWSTSPYTQDALWVCPGFNSDIVTYPDGSSIIIGIGDENQIWMQKLDPYGYKQWLPYVTVFPVMSNALRYFLPDDDGGIYAIIGSQAQRVDKNGNLRWGENGKKIIATGTNLHRVVKDGENGFIAIYNHFDSLQRTTVFRYDSSGTKLWEKEIDTSVTQNSFYGDIIGRLGKKTLIFSSKSGYKFINMIGEIATADSFSQFINNFQGIDSFVTDDSVGVGIKDVAVRYDSLGRKLNTYKITKFTNLFEIKWSVIVEIYHFKGSYAFVMPPLAYDGVDGVFLFGALFDSTDTPQTQIHRITKNGLAY